MWGDEAFAVSRDGTRIGYVSAGSGPSVLLVHGGMADRQMWEPVSTQLTDRFRVTAMDRRGRGTSPDVGPYSLVGEFDDVLAVAEQVRIDQASSNQPPARASSATVNVVGHSIGATFVLGAAAHGARFGQVVLYEPPGPATVPGPWIDAVAGYIAAGQPGRAMVSFLQDRIGLTPNQIEQLRHSAATGSNWADIVTTTMVREARALAEVDLPALARQVHIPVTLLLGEHSPPWCGAIIADLHRNLTRSDVVTVTGQGHQATINDPDQIAAHITRLLSA